MLFRGVIAIIISFVFFLNYGRCTMLFYVVC